MKEFKFKLRQKVTFKEIKRPGIIDALGVFDSGIQYRVCYWNDGKRNSDWLYEEEIE